MISNLSLAKKELIETVEELIGDPIFMHTITHPDIDSKVVDNKLYWNLGFSQGFVVIDPKNKEVYRVFDADQNKEPLTKNSLCDPSTAQLVLDNINGLIDWLTEELEDVSIEEITKYFPPMVPPRTNKIM